MAVGSTVYSCDFSQLRICSPRRTVQLMLKPSNRIAAVLRVAVFILKKKYFNKVAPST